MGCPDGKSGLTLTAPTIDRLCQFLIPPNGKLERIMEPKADSPEFDETLRGDDFDFEFDEDFETEVRSEYVVMDAMRFDREAGTASCNFVIEDDVEDAFQIPGARDSEENSAEEVAGKDKKGKSKK